MNKKFELVYKKNNVIGLRYKNGIIYTEGDDVYEAFEDNYKILMKNKEEYDSSKKPIQILDFPKRRVEFFEFKVDNLKKELKEEFVDFYFSATAVDQYGDPIDVEYDKVRRYDEVGVYSVQAEVLGEKRKIFIEVIEKQEETNELEELKDEMDEKNEQSRQLAFIAMNAIAEKDMDIIELRKKNEELENLSFVALNAIAEKDMDIIELRKKNEELENLSFIALNGVAELDENIQAIKKKVEK